MLIQPLLLIDPATGEHPSERVEKESHLLVACLLLVKVMGMGIP
jgi:hypothetical protein